jgi:hypothetical protein
VTLVFWNRRVVKVMKAEGMTKGQLIEELARVRQEISDITGRLNNTLVGVLGNVSLAKNFHAEGGSREQVMQHLESAENTFVDVRVLTGRMFDLAQDGDNE